MSEACKPSALVLWVQCTFPKHHTYFSHTGFTHPSPTATLLCPPTLKKYSPLHLTKSSSPLKANSNPYIRSYLNVSWTSPAHKDLSHPWTPLSPSYLFWDSSDSFKLYMLFIHQNFKFLNGPHLPHRPSIMLCTLHMLQDLLADRLWTKHLLRKTLATIHSLNITQKMHLYMKPANKIPRV